MNQIVIVKEDNNMLYCGPGWVEIGTDGIILKLHDIKDGDEYTLNKPEHHGDNAYKAIINEDGNLGFLNMESKKKPQLNIIKNENGIRKTLPTNKVNLKVLK